MSVAEREREASLELGTDKRKRDRRSKRKNKGRNDSCDSGTTTDLAAVTGGINADHLAWKKISLENDEFVDFEEIEGVDVEYVEKDGHKLMQLKERSPAKTCN
jgi:intein/homing endonuclease